MPARALNELLDKLVSGQMKNEECDVLIGALHDIEQDKNKPSAERMAAIVLRASLEARRFHAAS